MKNKILTSIIFGILMVSLAYALTIQVTPTTLQEFTKSQTSRNFTILNPLSENETVEVTLSNIGSITDDGNIATFTLNPSGSFMLPPGESRVVNVQMQGSFDLFDFGEYTTNLQVTSTNGTETTQPTTVNIKYISSFCDNGPIGNDFEISDVDINNLDGDEDDEWFLLDDIEVEVEVENNGVEDIREVFIELGFFDSDGNDMARDFDFSSADDEEADIGRVGNDDTETHTFRFRVPADFDEGNYKLAIKAYSKDLGEENLCVDSAPNSDLSDDFFGRIDVSLEDDEDKFVVVDDISLPTEVTCGETVLGSLKVFNIGEDDQDRVKVLIFNDDLDLDLEEEIRSGLDIGDDASVDFSFTVPNNIEDKIYPIEIRTEYEYDDGAYERISDETWTGLLKVIGCGFPDDGNGGTGGNLIVTASLESEAIAGDDLIVRGSFTNTGTETKTYIIDAKGYQSWAELKSISQRTLTIPGGETRTADFTFTVNSGASGPNSFIIEITTDGVLDVQEVEVNIKEAEDGTNGLGFLRGNSLVWIIVAINILLIILIIIVAVRISKR